MSYPPYIFECLLYADVDDVTSSCKIGDGVVAFRLVKKEPEIWGRLHSLDMSKCVFIYFHLKVIKMVQYLTMYIIRIIVLE